MDLLGTYLGPSSSRPWRPRSPFVFQAVLRGIPVTLIEAARLDGELVARLLRIPALRSAPRSDRTYTQKRQAGDRPHRVAPEPRRVERLESRRPS
jgi:hypothetical protein